MSESPLKQNRIIALDRLIPHPANFRQHPDEQIQNLVLSLQRFGQGRSIVIQDAPDKHLIVAGHGIVEAAKSLKWPELRADILPADWTPEQIKGYLIADNMHAQGASDDESILAQLLEEQKNAGYTLASLGSDDETLRQMLESLGDGYLAGDEAQEGAGGDEFDVNPDEVEIRCKRGDLWQLGEHRLLVDDCTKPESIKRLMQDKKIGLVTTSPPYTDQREYGLGSFDWHSLMCGAFDQMIAHSKDDVHILINLGLSHKGRQVDLYWNTWLDYCSKNGWPLFGWYVWDKGSGMPGEWNGRLAPAHEFVFHFNRQSGTVNKWVECTSTPKSNVMTTTFRQKDGTVKGITSPDKVGQPFKVPDSVIRIGREQARGMHTDHHPAVFPIALPEFMMETWSDEGDIIYEPFCGSGTTIIAAQRLSRRCFACEIDEKYATICLMRWEAETNQQAQLLERVEVPAHA